ALAVQHLAPPSAQGDPGTYIKRLQAKVSSNRKTIERLRKEQKQKPRSALEALEM
ncbi:hypothetical protein HPB47_002274, partial [Ixodes persulcatus]